MEIDSVYRLEQYLLNTLPGDGWKKVPMGDEDLDGDQELNLFYREPVDVMTSNLKEMSEADGEVYYHFSPVYAMENGKRVRVYSHPFTCDFVRDCEDYLRTKFPGDDDYIENDNDESDESNINNHENVDDHPQGNQLRNHRKRRRRVVVACQLYSDKARVTQKGSVQGYPIYCVPENLSYNAKVDNLEKYLVGLLPVYHKRSWQTNAEYKTRNAVIFQSCLAYTT